MASLVAEYLHGNAKSKNLIINLSMIDFHSNKQNFQFEEAFEIFSDLKWCDLDLIAKERTVYLILDEIQINYNHTSADGRDNSPQNKSDILWSKIKSIISNASRYIVV